MIADSKKTTERNLTLASARQMNSAQATLTDLTQWQATLRAAMVNAIDENDMKEIVEQQVKKAKAGDERALKFVLDMVGAKTPITITNNLVVDAETAARLQRLTQ